MTLTIIADMTWPWSAVPIGSHKWHWRLIAAARSAALKVCCFESLLL